MQYAYAYQLNGTQTAGLDPDAKAYILAVEAADGQTLEVGVKKAYNTFVKGCKSDGIWDAIKASCVMAGARTLSGALVPLKGTAPTNLNFVSGDYARKTGLVGNGSTKYLNSNRSQDADPQNSQHISVYASTAHSGVNLGIYTGARDGSLVETSFARSGAVPANMLIRSRSSSLDTVIGSGPSIGFIGVNRGNSASFVFRSSGSNTSLTRASSTPSAQNIGIFNRIADLGGYCNGRLAFYSIGESLDLSKLDSRVDRLVAELAFNINTGLDGSIYDIDTLKYINAGYAAGGTLS
jgi:hypothetical protein